MEHATLERDLTAMHSIPADKTLVSERALISRLNRVLRLEQRKLHKTPKKSRWYRDLGDYAVVDLIDNQWIDTHVDLETFGREKRVLRDSERLVTD